MPVTVRQKVLLAVAFLVLAGLGFAFLRVFVPLLKEYQETEQDVQGLARQLDNLRGQFNYYSNPLQYIDDLRPVVAVWENACNRRAKLFTTTVRKIPPGEKTPEFYFSEQWDETSRRLVDKSRRLNIPIPVDVGVGVGFPPPEQVETLLNQMSYAEYVLNLAMDCGVLVVTNFSVHAPTQESGFIQVIPIQISFTASLDALKKFLHWCGSGSQYLKVETISLRVLREVSGATNFDAQLFLTGAWVELDKTAVVAAKEGAAPLTVGFASSLAARRAQMRARAAGTPVAGGESGTSP